MLRPAVLILLVALGLSACFAPPESRVALSEPGEAAYDGRLVGIWTWQSPDGDGAYSLHIAAGGEGSLDVIGIGIGYDSGERVRWLTAAVHAAELDGETYYNVRRLTGAEAGTDYTAADETPGFIIVRTKLSADGALFLRFMDHDHLGRLTQEGRVSGREVDGDYKGEDIPYVVLDVSRPELVALIRDVTPEELFRFAVGPFHRLTNGAGEANAPEHSPQD